jgi:hypothetical protein
MADTPENRRFLRVATAVEVEVAGAGGSAHGTTRDISLAGMFVKTDQPIPEGSTCTATLFIDGRAGTMQIVIQGEIVRVGSGGMAIGFTALSGLESWEHLRNLILMNAVEPAQAHAEFSRHLGLLPTEP